MGCYSTDCKGLCFQEEDDGSDTEGLKDILPGDLLDTDLVNTIMNEDDDITKSEDNLDDIGGWFSVISQ
jgi:hypothetical protein